MSVHDIISYLIMLIGTKIIMRWLFIFMPLLVSNLFPSSRASWDLGILGLYFFLWKLLSDYLTCLIVGTRKRKKVNKRCKTKSVKKIFIQILGVLKISDTYTLYAPIMTKVQKKCVTCPSMFWWSYRKRKIINEKKVVGNN